MKRNNHEVLMHAILKYYKMNKNQDFIICFAPKVAIFQSNKIVSMQVISSFLGACKWLNAIWLYWKTRKN